MPTWDNLREGAKVRLVPIGKVAEQFQVTPATVRNWVEKGYLHAVKLPSGQRRIPQQEIDRLLTAMFDFGVPETDDAMPRVAASTVADEDWGP